MWWQKYLNPHSFWEVCNIFTNIIEKSTTFLNLQSLLVTYIYIWVHIILREAEVSKFVVPILSGYRVDRSILGDPGAVSRVGRKGATNVFKYGRKSPWVPTLAELFPKLQADAGSWLGTKNALYYCAQSATSFSWVLFVSSYTTAIVSITACLAHAPEKCTQSGNFQFDIKSPTDFKILSARFSKKYACLLFQT